MINNFSEIITGLVWAASAVSVLGYTWKAYSGAYLKFPDLSGGGSVLSIPTPNLSGPLPGTVNVPGLGILPTNPGILPTGPPGVLQQPVLPAPAKWTPPPKLIVNLYLAVAAKDKVKVVQALNAIGDWTKSHHVPPQAVSSYVSDFPWYQDLLKIILPHP